MVSSTSQQRMQLMQQVPKCMLRDQFRLKNRINRLFKQENIPVEKLEQLQQQLQRSMELRQRREEVPVTVSYPDLPVCNYLDEIKSALQENQVVVIAGETGSGKTTQLPKICMELGRGTAAFIGHTQPRRIAARSVSDRISEELGCEPGSTVGYKVRFNDLVSDLTRVKIMTDGILLSETQNDRFLEQYDTLIIDEAHERSLNIDFLLGFLKQLLPKRPDLKVIITSATIDVERFSRHFNNAPVIEVSGRSYPVDVVYRPLLDDEDGDADYSKAILDTVEEIVQHDQKDRRAFSDVLVFLPGEREIREAATLLRKFGPKDTDILPLYARLSAAEQQRVFQVHRGRRIVLATNVAETSLTVPNIRYVIDTGLARVSRYSYRSKVQRLPVEAISQASANQRKGRCGRVTEGTCYRLYSEEDFQARPEFTEPEILRTNLASVILQMKNLRLGEIEDFPYLEAPDSRLVKDGYKLLEELGAFSPGAKNRKLGKTGQLLARFPVDPRIARMLVAASQHSCVREMLVIASALSIQDPRERPHEKRAQADQAHAQYIDRNSDFLTFLNLWNSYEEQRQELSQNQLRKYCKKNFLSFMRMREWRDIHFQLKTICKELGFRENHQGADYMSIHKALLAGLPGHVINKHEGREYLGARNKKLMIFPGSGVRKTAPAWAMCAEQIETSALFASIVAMVQPEWVEEVASHLLKKHLFEPHWEKRRGDVVAFEQASLYGLVVNPRKRVSFGKFEPAAAREIFIREGLVNGQINTRSAFYHHNRELIAEIQELEHKSRRRDFLAEEETLFGFYNDRLPGDVYNVRRMKSWLKKHPQKQDELKMSREFLLQKTDNVSVASFPDVLESRGIEFPLEYHFEPGNEADGVTVTVPQPLIRQLSPADLEWLVPGMLREKCIAMVKSLPKAKRKNFVPVPQYVDAFLQVCDQYRGQALSRALAKELQRMTGVRIDAEDWNLSQLEPVHFMRIRLVDKTGKQVRVGRNIHGMEEAVVESRQQENAETAGSHPVEKDGLALWPVGDIPEVVKTEVAGASISLYPALVDRKSSVAIRCFEEKRLANMTHESGLVRLLLIYLEQQSSYLHKKVHAGTPMAIKYCSQLKYGSLRQLQDGICFAAVRGALGDDIKAVRTQQGFDELLERAAAGMIEKGEQLFVQQASVIEQVGSIQKKLAGMGLHAVQAHGDIGSQLQELFPKDYLYTTPWRWLVEYPRYLKALERRLEKLPQQKQKDREWTSEIESLWQPLLCFREKHGEQWRCYPEVLEYRWMLEELRVSCWAQDLKTLKPVSRKRLLKLWSEIEELGY